MFFFLGIFVFVGLLIGAVYFSDALRPPDYAGDMDAMPEASEIDIQIPREPSTEEYSDPLSSREADGSVAGD